MYDLQSPDFKSNARNKTIWQCCYKLVHVDDYERCFVIFYMLRVTHKSPSIVYILHSNTACNGSNALASSTHDIWSYGKKCILCLIIIMVLFPFCF